MQKNINKLLEGGVLTGDRHLWIGLLTMTNNSDFFFNGIDLIFETLVLLYCHEN